MYPARYTILSVPLCAPVERCAFGWYIGENGTYLCVHACIRHLPRTGPPGRRLRCRGTEGARQGRRLVSEPSGAAAKAPPKKARTARGVSSERVYRHLRELIVWGKLAPGSRIVENDIALHLDVSRTPIRSALHRLQQEGYIVPSGRRKEHRLVIAPLTQDDARELFDVVGVVEGLAAAEAAHASPRTRDALVAELQALNDELADVARAGTQMPRHIFETDMKFHRRYVEAGAGPRVLALHDAIKPQAERYIHLYTSALVGEIGRSVEEHQEIIDRIASGNADGARRAVQRNWRNAAARLERVIAVMGEHGSW